MTNLHVLVSVPEQLKVNDAIGVMKRAFTCDQYDTNGVISINVHMRTCFFTF